MKLPINNLTWQTRQIIIKDRTYILLADGRKIPTWENMVRKAKKI